MSKPIYLSKEMETQLLEEFRTLIHGYKMSEGKVSYEKKLVWDDQHKAKVIFTPSAYIKMATLLDRFDVEVAWHGICARDPEDDTRFLITDILVYPQEIGSATVRTDQVEYQTWLYEQDDETFNHLRMQGHSHVRMGVSPSGVDLLDQASTLRQLKGEMFYVFMIWNKRYERDVKIYDMKTNTMYDTADVDILINIDGLDMWDILKLAKLVGKGVQFCDAKCEAIVDPETWKDLKSEANDDLEAFIKHAKEVAKEEKKSYTAPTYGGMYDFGYGDTRSAGSGLSGHSMPSAFETQDKKTLVLPEGVKK